MCQVIDESHTARWIVGEVLYNNFVLTNDTNLAYEVSQTVLKKFLSDIESVNLSFCNITNTIKSIDLTRGIFSYFIKFIERNVNLIKINSPDNQEISIVWNKFRCDMAYLRYNRDPSLVERVSEFLSYISLESKKFGQQNEALNDGIIWNEWKKILENPDIMDVGLATLCDKVDIINIQELDQSYIKLPIKTMQKIFTIKLNELKENLVWIAVEIKKI